MLRILVVLPFQISTLVESVDANMKLFTVEGTTLTEVDNPVVTIVSDRKITITADVTSNTSYTFRAVLCNPNNYTSGYANAYGNRKPKVATTQSPNGISNFDPNADILVSDDLVVNVGDSETEYEATNLVFRRVVVMNKMTLKNMVEGENVNRVVISSDKHLTGNLTATSNEASFSGQNKEISLNFNNVTVPASGQFPVYFATMPNDGHTLTVTVYTDQYTYTKTFGGGNINFEKGKFTTFGVSLPAGTPASSFADGDYAIVNVDGTRAAMAYQNK